MKNVKLIQAKLTLSEALTDKQNVADPLKLSLTKAKLAASLSLSVQEKLNHEISLTSDQKQPLITHQAADDKDFLATLNINELNLDDLNFNEIDTPSELQLNEQAIKAKENCHISNIIREVSQKAAPVKDF